MHIVLLAIVPSACGTPSEPEQSFRNSVIVAGVAPHLSVVATAGPNRVHQIGPVPRLKGPYALSPDSTTLYLLAYNTYPERELIVVDMRALAITRRMPLARLEAESRISGISIGGTQALAVSPDGSRLLLGAAQRDGVRGVVTLDSQTGAVLEFVGPVTVPPNGIVTLRPSSNYPNGVFAVAAARPTSGPGAGYLFLLDATTLAVRDSVQLAPNTHIPAGGLGQAVASPDGRRVYTAAVDKLIAYDVAAGRIVGSASLPSRGWITVSPDGTALYLTDPGDYRNSPGSGRIYVFGRLLEPRPPLDLPRLSNGSAQSTRYAAVGHDGSTLYVAAGTPDVGPLFPAQPGEVLVVDVNSGRVLAVHPVNDWALGPIFIR